MNATSTRFVCALALLALSTPVYGIQDAAQAPPAAKPAAEPPKSASTFSIEQLEQIVAPIALYPDTLLAQMMMGATYPLEIVEAARWQQKNASLKGKARDDALKAFDWDPSVKSLCTFPDVLTKMNENLDWTQDLGDAFLGQKTELFGAIQKMRGKAMEAGQLKTTSQQKVTQEADKIIVIESADPEVIYVPTYSPTVVYAGWSYPTYYYPPMYAYPPGAGFVSFGLGVAFGAAVWGNCDWNDCDVDIDIDHHNEFNRNVDRDSTRNKIENRAGDQAGNRAGTQPSNRAGNKAGNTAKFNHNPEHRKGVNYQNPSTAQKYGGGAGSNRVSKDQARGFDRGAAPSTGRTGPAGSRATPPSTAGSGARAPATNAGSGTRPPASTGAAGGRPTSGATGNAPRPSTKSTASGSSSGGSALSGSRSPSLDRASSTRGASSRSSGASRGGGRGGGGRGGGRR